MAGARPATKEDVEDLISMMHRFAGETELPLTFSEKRALETLSLAVGAKRAIILVWESNDVLGGFVFGSIGDEFSVEKCAYIQKFYVEREFRGLGVSDDLLRAFNSAALEKGATIIFSSATAGMGGRVERLYVDLFQRNGYTILGRVLVGTL